MRLKDDTKKTAIFHATIYLLNQIGFNNISMSKIAKEAGVSASTLYVYFDNKEDMLRKVYLEAKQEMVAAMCRDLHENETVKTNVFQLCKNILAFAKEYKDYLLVIDQLSFAPIMAEVSQTDIQNMFQPLFALMARGTSQQILKNIPPNLLLAYCYYPIIQVCKERWSARETFADIDDEILINMCWDAIRI